jgi:hypothetical protein
VEDVSGVDAAPELDADSLELPPPPHAPSVAIMANRIIRFMDVLRIPPARHAPPRVEELQGACQWSRPGAKVLTWQRLAPRASASFTSAGSADRRSNGGFSRSIDSGGSISRHWKKRHNSAHCIMSAKDVTNSPKWIETIETM